MGAVLPQRVWVVHDVTQLECEFVKDRKPNSRYLLALEETYGRGCLISAFSTFTPYRMSRG